MENNNDFNQEKKENITISKKSLYIAGGVALALVLLIGGYFAFFNKNEAKDTVVKNDSLAVKKDSTTINADSLKNSEGYDEESPYQSYSLIANAVSLPNGQKLKFGDRVFIHYENEGQEFKTAYLNVPSQFPSAKNNPVSLNENMIIPTYSFEDFKNNFSLAPYSALPSVMKKILIEENNKYVNGGNYKIAQNESRAKSTLASGDFDGDGIKDIAVILDDNERQYSRLLVICSNEATKKPYVAFAQNYSVRYKVRSFKKGASIYMDTSDLVKAPQDGVIIENQSSSYVVIYNSKNQSFEYYVQEPANEASDDSE